MGGGVTKAGGGAGARVGSGGQWVARGQLGNQTGRQAAGSGGEARGEAQVGVGKEGLAREGEAPWTDWRKGRRGRFGAQVLGGPRGRLGFRGGKHAPTGAAGGCRDQRWGPVVGGGGGGGGRAVGASLRSGTGPPPPAPRSPRLAQGVIRRRLAGLGASGQRQWAGLPRGGCCANTRLM